MEEIGGDMEDEINNDAPSTSTRSSSKRSSKSQEQTLEPQKEKTAGKSSSKKVVPIIFFTVVILMVAISLILSIVRSAGGYAGKLPVLLGISMLGILVIDWVLILLVRSGGIKRRNIWFIYLVGVFIVIECIFTDIVIFN